MKIAYERNDEMALSKDDLQSISLLLNEGLAPITKEMRIMKSEITAMKSVMVTKEELKEELKGLATKDELKNLATKEELKNLATKEELKNLATKEELEGLATKEDLKGLATKEDVREVFEELMKAEAWTGRIEGRVDELADKVDTLLLQSDNSAMLLKMINQQSAEVKEIRSRVEVLEMKLA